MYYQENCQLSEQPKPKLEDLSKEVRELTPEDAENVKGGVSLLKGTKPANPFAGSDPCDGGQVSTK